MYYFIKVFTNIDSLYHEEKGWVCECMLYVLKIVGYRFARLFCLPPSLVHGIAMSYTVHVSWQKEMMRLFASRKCELSIMNHSLPIVRKT